MHPLAMRARYFCSKHFQAVLKPPFYLLNLSQHQEKKKCFTAKFQLIFSAVVRSRPY